MDNIKENNIFQNFCSLSQKVQKIQEEIDSKQVTPQTRISLHKQLENLQKSFESLRQQASGTKKQATFQFLQIEEMDKQIVTLYRKIEEKFEKYEISIISKEALELGSSLESGKVIKIAKQVNELRHNIHFLFKHRRPSMQHRKIINLALKLADQANEILSTKGKTSKGHLQLIHLLKNLLKEAMLKAEMVISTEEGELATEIFEIADLYYQKKIHEANVRLNLFKSKLTLGQQKRLDEAKNDPEELISILMEIADGDPCHAHEEQKEEKIALIHELHA